jgi:hypothetical protein
MVGGQDLWLMLLGSTILNVVVDEMLGVLEGRVTCI